MCGVATRARVRLSSRSSCRAPARSAATGPQRGVLDAPRGDELEPRVRLAGDRITPAAADVVAAEARIERRVDLPIGLDAHHLELALGLAAPGRKSKSAAALCLRAA